VTSLRPDLLTIAEALLARVPAGGEIELDAIGEAIGARVISPPEIDAMITMLEERGRRVSSPAGGEGEATLKVVLATARMLRQELGRPPRTDEIAARASLSRQAVDHALALAKVIQR
jgi:hypothetical protein